MRDRGGGTTRRTAGALLAALAVVGTSASATTPPSDGWVTLVLPADPSALPKIEDDEPLLDESFETPWPSGSWRVYHPDDRAAVDWGPSSQRASDGQRSIWCAGAGAAAPAPGQPTPENTESWAIAGPFDFTEVEAGSLTFDLWLRTEQFHDAVMWLASTDGSTFHGRATSTDTSGWRSVRTDLTAWGTAGDLAGQPEVWIAFVYRSDQDRPYEGAYIDAVTMATGAGDSGEGFTYTSDADFELGDLAGVEASSGELRLVDGRHAYPFLWVPNTADGTVSKIDVVTGAEVGRYRTGPERNLGPSAVVVDLDGSCWVGNLRAGTVTKIGLDEADRCVDRDGDGEIRTSTDGDGDGDVTGDEVLAWGEDECALHEVALIEGSEATYLPGDSHGYENNGLDALAIDARNRLWAGVYDSRLLYGIDSRSGEILDTFDLAAVGARPSAAVVTRDGAVWVASWPDTFLARLDPTTREIETVALDHGGLGLALGDAGRLYVTGFTDAAVSRVDTSTLATEWSILAPWQASGGATTADGDLWVAAPGSNVVSRYSAGGFLEDQIQFMNGPVHLAVDSSGMVWVVGTLAGGLVVRLNPLVGIADLQKELVDASGHDAAGDMTGIVARSITTRYGSWTVEHDATVADTPWGTVSWVASVPDGTSLSVRVRSSQDRVGWSGWEAADSGTALAATPPGRYLQVEVALSSSDGDATAVLQELTLTTAEGDGAGPRRPAGRRSALP